MLTYTSWKNRNIQPDKNLKKKICIIVNLLSTDVRTDFKTWKPGHAQYSVASKPIKPAILDEHQRASQNAARAAYRRRAGLAITYHPAASSLAA